jgi:hypothetical protein
MKRTRFNTSLAVIDSSQDDARQLHYQMVNSITHDICHTYTRTKTYRKGLLTFRNIRIHVRVTDGNFSAKRIGWSFNLANCLNLDL